RGRWRVARGCPAGGVGGRPGPGVGIALCPFAAHHDLGPAFGLARRRGTDRQSLSLRLPALFPVAGQPARGRLGARRGDRGLAAALIARLTRFASWKNLGVACTLQLEPETVYRALETGETFESIRQALEQHGTRPTPAAVLDLLRTWANKRDRITVYPAATL